MRDFAFEFLGLYDYQARRLPSPELVSNMYYLTGYLIASKIYAQAENSFFLSHKEQRRIGSFSFQQILEELNVLTRLDCAISKRITTTNYMVSETL